MEFNNFLINSFEVFSNVINSLTFLIILIIIVILYTKLIYFFKDWKYIKLIKSINETETTSIEDLKDKPLVNILVPAWNEDKLFYDCLMSIKNLSYPKLKIIVNAGGNQETIDIAESFRKYDNFLILRQMEGKSRAALGKIKALNECLGHVSEGLIYMTDADCIFNDEIFLRIVKPLINGSEKIVIGGNRPIKWQQINDLVKYTQVLRLGFFKKKATHYGHKILSGANSCMKYEVLEKIGRFNEKRAIPEDISRGIDIISHGFEIYGLINYKSRIYTDFPTNFKEFLNQKKRYIENSLLLSYQHKKKFYFVKFTILMITSLALLLFPIFIFIHIGMFYIGIIAIFYMYLLRVRKLIFFKKVVEKEDYEKFGILFFFKILYFIYIERIINVITLFGLRSYIKTLKREIDR